MNEERYRKYARLAVLRGVNVQPGQTLVIHANVRDYAFVEMVVHEAYEAGAGNVEIDWRDTAVSHDAYQYRTKESLGEIPDWMYEREKHRVNNHACSLSITSDKPAAMKDVDQEKISAYNMAYSEKMKEFDHYYMANEGQWCVLGVPSADWAKVVFPDLPEDEAFAKLEEAIFYTARIDDESDPIENWKKHDAELIAYADKLNAYNFQTLHFTSELGTDLYVDLVEDHIWAGGGDTTPQGVYFDPNIPTEEIFTQPHRNGVNGIVYASKPLSYNGTLIENFSLTFKDGKVIEHHAEKGEESLKALLDFDEGSRHLGETALVPYDSPVSRLNFLFFNTLYDENAACHLALGQCYPENVKGGVDMSEEELLAHGGNSSFQHEDFMFGTRHMAVDGIMHDGTVVPLFREGGFVEEK